MGYVRERIPIGDMLRVLGTLHGAMPKLDIAACTNRHAARGEQENGLQGEQADGDRDPAQGQRRIGRAATRSGHDRAPRTKRQVTE